MELHTLKPFRGSKKSRKRIGRGLGSGHGAYSTRGIKGQRARSGGSKGLKARGLKTFLLRVPKIGGFRSIHPKSKGINVDVLEKYFSNSDTVSPVTLLEKKIIRHKGLRSTVVPSLPVKILGGGTLTKKLSVVGCMVSESAREKIEKAGGTIELPEKKVVAKRKKK